MLVKAVAHRPPWAISGTEERRRMGDIAEVTINTTIDTTTQFCDFYYHQLDDLLGERRSFSVRGVAEARRW